MVEVDAHSGRCTLAPLAASASQRGPENAAAEVLVGQLGLGDGGRAPQRQELRGRPVSPGRRAVSRRRSTSVSTRLTKNDATLRTPDEVAAPAAA